MVFFKYTKYISISLIVISIVYILREPLFAPSIKKYLSSKIKEEVDFKNFHILPFSLTVTNLKIADIFLAEKVSLNFDLIKLIFNIKCPLKAIREVRVSTLEVMISPEGSTIKNVTNDKRLQININSFNFGVFADKILLKNNYHNIDLQNTSLTFNEGKINFLSSLDINGLDFNVNCKLKQKSDKEFNTLTTIISKRKIFADIALEGTCDLDCNFYQNTKIRKLKYKGLNFDSFEGVISKSSDLVTLNMSGMFGKLKLDLKTKDVNIESYLSLPKINENLRGDINFKAKIKNNVEDINLDVKNLSIFNLGNANFNFDITKNEKGTYSGYCKYGENKKVVIIFSKDGSYEEKIIVNGKELGNIIGNIKKGTIKADIKNAELSSLPLRSFFGKKIDGVVNLYGQLDEISGQVNFSLDDFLNNKKLKGIITKNNDLYVFNFNDTNEAVLFNAVVKNMGLLSSDFKFVKIDSFKILSILGYSSDKFSGFVTGRVKYQKDTFLDFNFKAFNGCLYGNSFKKFDLKVNINSDEVNIGHCSMVDYLNKELINIKGILGFSKQNLESFLFANIKNFKIGFVNLTSQAEFKGVLDDKKIINGLLKISSINFSGAGLDDISVEVKMSNKEVKFYNLKSNQGIKADGVINLQAKNLRVELGCKKLDIKGLYKDFSGFLTFLANISGSWSNPEMDVSVDVSNGRYFTLPFSLLSEIKLKNRILIVNKAKVLSNRTNVSLSGNYTNSGNIDVEINNLDEKVINAFVGFRTPLNINLSGKGNITIKDDKPNYKLFLHSKTASIKQVKLNDVKCNLEIKDANVYLSSASCNISDSQIKADRGFFNLKDKSYGLDLFLVNVRVGFVDFLGSINLLGKMEKTGKSYEYRGSASLNNFWTSKYKLNSLTLNYYMKNKTLEIRQQDDKNSTLKISALVVFRDVLSIRKLNILKGETFFNLSSDISKNFVDLAVKGINLDSKVIMDVFNLGSSVFGKANVNLNLFGDIKKPKGNLQVNSKNGIFMEVPYDSLNLALNLENNRIYINKANIFKQNELQISINGNFPFYLQKDLIDKQSPVNIFYEINDYKLNILKYMSLEFIKPFSGKMFLKGSFTGDLGKINSNAKLSINGASLELKEYLKKVKNMCVGITLVNNLLTIDNFSLKSGSGKLDVYGNAKLNNFNVDSFDIRLVTTKKGLPIRIPQLPLSFLQDYSFGEPSFDIRLMGDLANPKISGKVILENTRFTYPSASESNKESIFPDATYFDLDFFTAKNTRFENSYVSALISGSLHLEGCSKNLKANGIIETSNATVDYLGIIFDISNARLEIMKDKSIYLTLMGETSGPVKGGGLPDIIKLVVNKTKLSELFQPGAVKLIPKDNSNMDFQKELEKVSGLDTKQNMPLKVSDSFQQTIRLLNQTLTTPFAKAMLRKTGLIDNFKVSYIDTKAQDGSDNSSKTRLANLMLGTKYSLEKNITNQALLGYSITFDEFNKKINLKHSLEMRYKLSDNLYINGNYGLDDKDETYQADKKIMVQHQLRFGPSYEKKKK
ncbi:MAG: translocation/assembly module TamB [Endomicrobium sp.]|jgi:hypothetical protein|nr:translocation/assembly module TamB [Endomicrobium sp.]